MAIVTKRRHIQRNDKVKVSQGAGWENNLASTLKKLETRVFLKTKRKWLVIGSQKFILPAESRVR